MKYFAGFIITFERPEIIAKTIAQIFRQSLTPEKLLVVDNSISDATRQVIAGMNDARIEYVSVGYNSGPAGAAKIGLDRLAQEGFQWIYWGDDDDPPIFSTSFEWLCRKVAPTDKRIGIMGCVGQYFNRTTGTIDRVPDSALENDSVILVDSIAGNQTMVVNADVVRRGVLPDPSLFFGFEELDFCLKVQAAGYTLAVPTELFRQLRLKFGKVNFTRSFYLRKKESALIRQYYSTRNIVRILNRNRLYMASACQLITVSAKAIWGFRYGWRYGARNFFYLWLGALHGFVNRSGQLNQSS